MLTLQAAIPVAAQSHEPATIRLTAAEPGTIDPGLTETLASFEIVSQIFEGLLGIDADGKVFPVEAERWEVSADLLTYTFSLRPSMRWSDGRSITAADYEYGWKRNIDPKTDSAYSATMSPVKNASLIMEGLLAPDQLGVRALNDRTLQVALAAPAAYFPSLVSTPIFYPLPRWAIDQHGEQWTHPGNIVTNGRYRLERWEPGLEIVLARYEGHLDPSPIIQRARYSLVRDESVLQRYVDGEIDIASVSKPDIEFLLRRPDLLRQLQPFDLSSTLFVAVNHRKTYLQDSRVRRALGMAIDRETVVENVRQTEDRPAYSLQPPDITGSDPSLWPGYDPEGSQRLYEQAGRPVSTLVLAFRDREENRELVDYLANRWRAVLGIETRPMGISRADFYDFTQTQDWENDGELILVDWISDYRDPNNWYNALWDSSNDPSRENAGWMNPAYDEVVRAGQSEPDADARAALYAQAESILADEYPHIPLFHYRDLYLVKPHVRGFHPILGVTNLDSISITE